MLARGGKSREDIPKSSKLGKVLRAQGVQRTAELERIVRIPRRAWEVENIRDLAAMLADAYRLPGSTMELRDIQAVSLRDAHDFGGLFGPIRVGGGKTLTTFLAPTVLEAPRSLLVVPAKLREKTLREFAQLRKHWTAPVGLEIVSYEKLGREDGGELLERIDPALIILDEAQKAKNPKAAVTRRLERWFKARPETACMALSGTITQRSIRDFAHIIRWCLKHAPVPSTYNALMEWAGCLDVKLPPDVQRLAPGALAELYNEEERAFSGEGMDQAVTAARTAFGRRLRETPGVVGTQDEGPAVGLTVAALEVRDYNRATVAAFESLRERWELPDGQLCVSPADVWRHARELALGFYYRWKVPGPDDWMEARRRWGMAVRHVLANNRSGLDSELPVKNACRRGDFDRNYIAPNGVRLVDQTIGEIYRSWEEIKPTFVPETEAIWIDPAPLELVAKWADENAGIVFVEHVAFAEELARRTGRAYFGEGGKDKRTRRFIEDARPADGSVIASVASNQEGRNLQAWSRALVISAPPNGGPWEQLLGRLHRDGQEADEVTFELLIGCFEQLSGFDQAKEDARYIHEVLGSPQKLLCADLVFPDWGDIHARPGPLWQR